MVISGIESCPQYILAGISNEKIGLPNLTDCLGYPRDVYRQVLPPKTPMCLIRNLLFKKSIVQVVTQVSFFHVIIFIHSCISTPYHVVQNHIIGHSVLYTIYLPCNSSLELNI